MLKALVLSTLFLAPATIEAEKLLVAIEGGGAVAVSAETGAVLETYATGADAFGAAYTPDGKRAFVTDKAAGTLSEVDPDSDRVLATIQVGAGPQQPAIGADGRAYIPLSGEGAIAVVSIRSPMAVLRRISTGAGSKPHIVSLSPNGRTLWATVQGIDPKVVAVPITATAEGPPREHRYDLVPRVIAATNAGAFFTAHHSTGLHYVDGTTGSVSTPFMDSFGRHSEARKQIEGVSASPDGRLVAITHEGRRALVIVSFDPSGAYLGRRSLSLPGVPYWVTLDPSQEAAYVSFPSLGEVRAYDLTAARRRTLWTAAVGGKPKRMDATRVP